MAETTNYVIKGAWKLKGEKGSTIPSEGINITQEINISYYDVDKGLIDDVYKIEIRENVSSYYPLILVWARRFGDGLYDFRCICGGGGWNDIDVNNPIIDFGSTPQEVSKEFYDIIHEHAEQVNWNDYYKIVSGKYKWNDTLDFEYYRFKPKKVGDYELNLNAFEDVTFISDDTMGISGCVLAKQDVSIGIYINYPGVLDTWLDGSVTVEEFFQGVTPVPSDIYQTWEFEENTILPIVEYNYLTTNTTPVYEDLDEFFTVIGNAIRTKKGTTDKIKRKNIPSEILNIDVPTGGGSSGEISDGYKIRYIDADGTILKTEYVEGGKLTPPSNPTYDSEYLEFNTWNCDIENYVVDKDTDVGATYKTKTGDTYFFIRLTESTGLTIPALQISGATSIDWGDGTVDANLTHTYADYGDYVIKISGITEITSYLFGSNNSSYNSSLLKCYLGDSVTNIGNYAFFNCYSLTNVVIPENVTNIGVYTFQGCYSLTSVVISNTVTNIGNYAFQDCSSLASVVIPEGIINVGTSVFYNCYSLTSVVIPGTLTSIGERMFSCCYSLTNVAISKNVTSIGNEAFQSCYSLTNVIIPDTVISMGNKVFANCHSLINVAIPNLVTSIGSSTFVNCYSLTNITIPKNVTAIGDGAFRACYSLANISIHDGMIAIKDSTFSNCSLLTSIAIPSTVTSIESYAFSGCYKIKDYVLKCSSVPTLVSKYAFSTINKVSTIWVKDELVESYKTATNWSTYATHIKPISSMPQQLKEELGVL